MDRPSEERNPFLDRWRKQQWARYVVAFACVAAAVFIRRLMDPVLGDRMPLVTLFAAVAVSVWFGGWRPTVVTWLVGFLAADWLFIPPRGSLLIKGPVLWAMLAGWAFSCGIIIYLGEAMHRARARYRANLRMLWSKQEQLEKEIAERRQAQEELSRAKNDLETQVAQRTASLTETVGQLESFSYTIVHDLRAPLRAMHGFSQILNSECGDKIGDKGRVYLERIISSASRMDLLIRDVLTYSRIARSEMELQPIKTDELLRGILGSYPTFQPPAAEVIIEGTLPMVLGNEALLTQCFSNLLGNAVKFVSPGVIPQVKVWAQSSPPRVRFWLEDNGVGIAREQQERIFGVFQRLSNTYEGTGIGLAIVSKASERMGGTAGVESEPGLGSRFWLDLALA